MLVKGSGLFSRNWPNYLRDGQKLLRKIHLFLFGWGLKNELLLIFY